MKRHHNGNAMVFVLLGVVLFGLLSYTLINSAKTGQGSLSKHQVGLLATEIMGITATIEKNYNNLRSQGCGEGEISFEHDGILVNAGAPADQSCHMFTGPHSITYTRPPAAAQAQAIANTHGFDWYISNDNKFSDVGINTNTIGRETAIILPAIRESICRYINEQVGIGSIIPIETTRQINVRNFFSFGSGTGTLHWCDDNAIPCSRTEFCVDQRGGIFPTTIPAGFIYVKVIHVR